MAGLEDRAGIFSHGILVMAGLEDRAGIFSHGILVMAGLEDRAGAAMSAGVAVGEFITAVQGVPVASKHELQQQLDALTAGPDKPMCYKKPLFVY